MIHQNKPVPANSFLHCSHWKGFDLLCMFICASKCCLSENPLLHIWHRFLNTFLLTSFLCLCKPSFVLKFFSQQLNSTPAWVSQWIFTANCSWNLFRRMGIVTPHHVHHVSAQEAFFHILWQIFWNKLCAFLIVGLITWFLVCCILNGLFLSNDLI